jgi:hypothetical protein
MTNSQSRTAIAIMPPLFIFAVTAEQKLTHRMHEVASESEHNIQVCFFILSAIAIVAAVYCPKYELLYTIYFLF